jgi:hypothetical protein
MLSVPNSPRLIKGGLVLVDPDSRVVQKIIVLQYNSDSLSRTLLAQGFGESGDPSEALDRKWGPGWRRSSWRRRLRR